MSGNGFEVRVPGHQRDAGLPTRHGQEDVRPIGESIGPRVSPDGGGGPTGEGSSGIRASWGALRRGSQVRSPREGAESARIPGVAWVFGQSSPSGPARRHRPSGPRDGERRIEPRRRRGLGRVAVRAASGLTVRGSGEGRRSPPLPIRHPLPPARIQAPAAESGPGSGPERRWGARDEQGSFIPNSE